MSLSSKRFGCHQAMFLFQDNIIKEENRAYAIKLSKPFIPLKEKSFKIGINYQWVEFDRSASPEQILSIVMNAIGKVKSNRGPLSSEEQKILAVALLSFLSVG
jgi:hypothetical protein